MEIIEPGTILLLELAESYTHKAKQEYDSVFEKHLSDNHMLIAAPTQKGSVFPIPIGEKFYVHFNTKESRCHFMCAIEERTLHKESHFVKIRMLSRIAEVQRRGHFRIRKNMRGKLTIEHHEHTAETGGDKATFFESDCLTHDISVGGLLIYTREPYEKYETIVISIPVGENGEAVDFKSKVMWCRRTKKGEYEHCAGIEFMYENEKDKEDMARFVSKVQEERRIQEEQTI